jgi:hypothetical protein
MTTVNVRKKAAAGTETPSDALVKKAAAEVTIQTPNGFAVTLKRPGVLSSFRLVKMLGDAARNVVYMNMVLPFTYITAIDGRAVAAPNTEREIEALITRLDEEGVAAVMNAVSENFGAQQDPEEAQAEVKN